jgi:hypothetical protein
MIKETLKYAVTPKNILLRYLKEKKKNPVFGFLDIAKKFGIINARGELQKGVAWKWTESGVHKRKPNQTVKCTQCNKTQHDRVFNWINDGGLQQ